MRWFARSAALLSVLVLGLSLSLALAACSGGSSPATAQLRPAATTPVSSDVRAAIAYDTGGRGDRGYGQSAAAGVDRAEAGLGVQVKETQAAPKEPFTAKIDRLTQLAKDGYTPVIAIGLGYAGAVAEVADDYPDTQFTLVDTDIVKKKNVTSLMFDQAQGSYLVGVIAAQASASKKVGFIGGAPGPIMDDYEKGFAAGATAGSSGVKVAVTYLSKPPLITGFDDVPAAKSAAKKMFDGGTDVVYVVAGGSGAGVFDASVSAGTWAIGTDWDEYRSAGATQRPAILTSMVKQVDVAVYALLKAADDGKPLTGTHTFGVKDGAVGWASSNPKVQPFQQAAEQAKQMLLSGTKPR